MLPEKDEDDDEDDGHDKPKDMEPEFRTHTV